MGELFPRGNRKKTMSGLKHKIVLLDYQKFTRAISDASRASGLVFGMEIVGRIIVKECTRAVFYMAGTKGDVSVFQDVSVRGAVLQCLGAFGVDAAKKKSKGVTLMSKDRRFAMTKTITKMVVSELLFEYESLASMEQTTESLQAANDELIQITQESMRDKLLIADREYVTQSAKGSCNEATGMFANFCNLSTTDDSSSSDESN